MVTTGLGEHFDKIDPTKNPDLNDIATTYAIADFLVAWCDGRIIGCGALVPRPGQTAEIVRMSVAADMRRQGIVSGIVERLVEIARERGNRQVILETTATWMGVIEFYLRCGFRITHYQDGEVYFARDLP
jgi:N-acetylglutamate synthase-like GNAT family acetyltransferase